MTPTVLIPLPSSDAQHRQPVPSAAGNYRLKTSPWSSHSRILAYLTAWPRTTRILDVGTAEGYIGQSLRRAGFTHVVGLERDSASAASARAWKRLFAYQFVVATRRRLP